VAVSGGCGCTALWRKLGGGERRRRRKANESFLKEAAWRRGENGNRRSRKLKGDGWPAQKEAISATMKASAKYLAAAAENSPMAAGAGGGSTESEIPRSGSMRRDIGVAAAWWPEALTWPRHLPGGLRLTDYPRIPLKAA